MWQGIPADPNLIYLGGYLADALVCSCTMAVIPNLTRGLRPYGRIENVVTHADHRRQGYGRCVLALEARLVARVLHGDAHDRSAR